MASADLTTDVAREYEEYRQQGRVYGQLPAERKQVVSPSVDLQDVLAQQRRRDGVGDRT